ncbi:MAG: arginine--tRNA ligase [Anaerolineae bacterium]|nr:arginine--tRNA ligase [Anaerolineae bacterium]NUQ03880.1 arginine--tRNA ligase [Anaerolineae bacterium]
MKLLPRTLAGAVHSAITSAQSAGALPAFDMPEIDVRPPKRAEQGDYAVSLALGLAKATGMKPLDIANAIAAHLTRPEFIAEVEVIPPGFINFRLDETWLRDQVEAIIAEGDKAFQLDLYAGKRAQVEFVSANPSGPITVGRSRGGVIGDTMARLLQAAGYEVEREYYFNNAGRQMRNVGSSLKIRYLEALGKPVVVPDSGDDTFYQGDYLIEFAHDLIEKVGESWVDSDWHPFKDYAEERMFGWIRASLARVGILHDVYFNENSLYESGAIWKVLEALEAGGYVYRATVPEAADSEEVEEAGDKGEAVWFRSTHLGDDKDRVLVKSSGEPTYTLPDIAYHVNKLERGFDLLVNILGADHGAQYKVVQYGVQALGMDPSKIHVIINQMVRALRDGKEVRMSTRRGVYDTLDDLIEQTSADAVRYMLLARSADSHLNFDLDLAVKRSNENPVYYIRYAHVRCAGIFREAAARGVSDDGADVSLLGAAELGFLRKALELGEVIDAAARFMEPHRIAFYALELANAFHPIFDNVRVMHTEVPPELAKARLRFYRAAQGVFARVLDLMGMSAPDVM